MSGPRCGCGKPASYTTIWQTPFMPQPSIWHDCAACLVTTVRMLKAHPQIVVETKELPQAKGAA